MRIYLDADDTLGNFRQHAIERYGVPPWEGSWYTTDKATWPQEYHDIQAATNRAMEHPMFWLCMPANEGAHDLVHAARSWGTPYVLTALPYDVNRDLWPRIEDDKRTWAAGMFNLPPENVVVCQRHEKLRYAKIGSVVNLLIDDAEQNCEEWRAAGGLAIHYTDAESAIAKLVAIVERRTTA